MTLEENFACSKTLQFRQKSVVRVVRVASGRESRGRVVMTSRMDVVAGAVSVHGYARVVEQHTTI